MLVLIYTGMKDYYASIADTYKKLSETHKSWDISVSESCQKISITADSVKGIVSDEVSDVTTCILTFKDILQSLNMEDQFRDFAREVAEMRVLVLQILYLFLTERFGSPYNVNASL